MATAAEAIARTESGTEVETAILVFLSGVLEEDVLLSSVVEEEGSEVDVVGFEGDFGEVDGSEGSEEAGDEVDCDGVYSLIHSMFCASKKKVC